MAELNKYGLSRDIPEPIKREIRQRCGFGCLLCGMAIIQYAHIDPPWAEAKEHDPSKIALLCGTHHDEMTRGRLSEQTIKEALADPWCKRKRHTTPRAFDVGAERFVVQLGGTILDCQKILVIEGETLLAVRPPEEPGGPYQLDAIVCDERGHEILRIKQNEWSATVDSWDIEVEGSRIDIRTQPGKIALTLRVIPRRGLVVERINMMFRGTG